MRAAELTGQLDDALDQLSTYLERDLNARRQVKSSLTYPTFVFATAIVAVVVMSVWVLPKFKEFYQGLGANLPLPTRILLGFTNFVGQWWYAIVGAVAVMLVIGFALFGGKHGKRRRDHVLMKIPAIGPLVHIIAVERFCRVFAALVQAGVSLPDALRSQPTARTTPSSAKLATAREAMIRGDGLAQPIAASGIFPAAAKQMIRVGESTGSLDEQLESAATFYERELTYRLILPTSFS